MKTLKVLLVIVTFILTNNVNAQTIISNSTGGDWDDQTTWVGNTVPISTDNVEITSTVYVDGTHYCNNLTITTSGILKNDNSGRTLIVSGVILNNGTIQNNSSSYLDIRVEGDITNNGIWENNELKMDGSIPQTITATQPFEVEYFITDNSSSYISLNSDITFINTEIDNYYDSLFMNGNILSLNGGFLGWTHLHSDGGEINSSNDAYIRNQDIYGAVSFTGNTIIDIGVDCWGVATNIGTLENKNDGNYDIRFHNNLINNGIIENNNNYELRLYIYKDFYNYGTLNNDLLKFSGDTIQNIFSTNTLTPDYVQSQNTDGHISLLSDIYLITNNINLDWEDIHLNDKKLTVDCEYFIEATINSNFGTLEMTNDCYLRFIDLAGDINLEGKVQIEYNVDVNGNITVLDTLMNYENSSRTLYVEGNITNNGYIIDNNGYSFDIDCTGNISNNGVWSCNEINLMSDSIVELSMTQAITTNDIWSSDTTGYIIALSDISFINCNVDMNYEEIYLNGFTFSNDGALTEEAIFYSSGGSIHGANNHEIKNIIFNDSTNFIGETQIGYNVLANNSVNILGTITNEDGQNREFLLNSDLYNSGIIQNTTSNELELLSLGNIYNSGQISCELIHLDGITSTPQEILNSSTGSITSLIRMDENVIGGTNQEWFKDGVSLYGETDGNFINETSYNLTTTNPLSSIYYGNYHCVTTQGNSRTITIGEWLTSLSVDAGINQSICDGGFVTLTATTSYGSAPYFFEWSNGETTQSITVSPQVQTIYSITVTDSNSNTATDDVTVFVGQTPLINLGADLNLPAGSTPTLNAGPGLSDYLWSTSETTQTITVSTSGTYSVTITNSNGCTNSDEIIVTIAPSYSSAYVHWISPSGSNIIGDGSESNPYATFQYAIDQCAVGDTVMAKNGTYIGTGNRFIQVTVSGITIISQNGPELCIIDGQNNTSETNCFTIFGPFSQDHKISGFTVENFYYDAVSINSANPTIDNCILRNCNSGVFATSVYPNETSPTITGCLIYNNVTGIQMQNGGSPLIINNTIVDNSDEGIYFFYIDGIVGNNIVANNSVGLALQSSSAANNYNNIWGNTTDYEYCTAGSNSISSNPLFISITDYHLQSTSPCIDAGNPITFDPDGSVADIGAYPYISISSTLSADAGMDAYICEGESTTLTATATDGLSPYYYEWSNGSTSQSISVSPGSTTTYTVTITDSNNDTANDFVIVNVIPLPAVDLGLDINSCIGMSEDIHANISGDYAWSTGQTGPYILVTTTGVYSLTVTDGFGCIGSDEVLVTFHDLPIIDLGIDQSITLGDDYTFDAGAGFSSYDWSTGDATQTITVDIQGTYYVTVTDNNNCENSDDVYLTVNDPINNPGWTTLNTSIMHTILIPDSANITIDGSPISIGDYIGVFYDFQGVEVCAGYTIWTGLTTDITAWGDDITTQDKDGFETGETMSYVIWKASTGDILHPAVDFMQQPIMPNQGDYAINGLSGILSMTATTLEFQNIEMPIGWSYFSTYIDLFNPEIDSVFSDIVSQLIICKDGDGFSYWPQWGLNNIGTLEMGKGYQAKMLSAQTLVMEGIALTPELTPLTIPQGWSMLGYLRQNPAAIETVFSSIVNDVIIVKNTAGQVYWPQYGSNFIGNMNPGEGYPLKMAATSTLVYGPNSINLKSNIIEANECSKYKPEINSGENMTIGIPVNAWKTNPNMGSEIGVFNSKGKLVGASKYDDNFTSITLWGKDNLEMDNKGLSIGEEFKIMIWDQYSDKEYVISNLQFKEGSINYKKDKISIVSHIEINDIEKELSQISIYPNPTSSNVNIQSDSKINRIVILNSLGEVIQKLDFSDGGKTLTDINLENNPTGIYLVQIYTETNVISKLVELNK